MNGHHIRTRLESQRKKGRDGGLAVRDPFKRDVENEVLVPSVSRDSILEMAAHALHNSSECCRDSPGCSEPEESHIKVKQELCTLRSAYLGFKVTFPGCVIFRLLLSPPLKLQKQ